ncbi:unnamed protein product [Lactuca saligna]|uniref:Reverse transcriptase Ty1/copia-type domain-containing protein n=1 Tax=Lactuca saligna TaxID=75948 RepID=A0AA35ZVR0_LACSI|nr:unnamed protein product [Lactuca saligna]
MLQQAPRAWYNHLTKALQALGFNGSVTDPSLFVYSSNGTILYMLVYVDDIVLTGNNSKAIDRVIKSLGQTFCNQYCVNKIQSLPNLSLKELDLFSNLLNGTIPVSIGQLAKIGSLHVSNNSLEGVVFEAHFGNLLMLRSLDASSNTKLTFNFSHEWIPPFQLEDLDLSSCNISNRFPQWLRNQRKLGALVLSNATISGPLPSWLRKMLAIHFLDLSHNKLSGSLANLPNRGTVCVIGTGGTLLLANNIFNESLPRSLCKRTDLNFLDLSRNRLTGKFPKCLQNLQLLNTMMFSSNLLSVLDVGDNELFGSIPHWIGEKLTDLNVLRLHRNNFSGEIPKSLCKMLELQILDVAYNNLRGIIPHCLRELNRMVKGPRHSIYNGFPDSNENVIQIMKGEIPIEITALSMLVGLNLSNNHLSGNIPEKIRNMMKLESLDLSGNESTGMIPSSMATLTFLSHLNLSRNSLLGRIPTGRQLQTLTNPSIHAGNKAEESIKVRWFYLDIMSGFATGFSGIIGVAEETVDRIYVSVMVRVAKMNRGREATRSSDMQVVLKYMFINEYFDLCS